MLRVIGQYSELVWDPVRVLGFLLFEHGVELLTGGAGDKFRVQHGILEELVARLDVALDDFLKVLEEVLTSNLEFGANGGTWGFAMLLDVDVHDVLTVELPGQCDVLGALGAWSEEKLSNVCITKLLHSCSRVHIHELRVVNSARDESPSSLVAISIP
jgi:hypothetical protein